MTVNMCMPVIIDHDNHPFLPRKGQGLTIDQHRAEHQDIRPIEILMFNFMGDKIATERQITRLLGANEIQVHMTFAATDSYMNSIAKGRTSKNTSTKHIRDFYHSFADIKGKKFDGLVITGMNALCVDMMDEEVWEELKEILEWSDKNVTSTLLLCWAAQAALQLFHGIGRKRRTHKAIGLFEHKTFSDKCHLVSGLPDRYMVPVGNWDHTSTKDILGCPALELIASNKDTGAGFISEPVLFDDGRYYYPKRLYSLIHPEYDTDTIDKEYKRDMRKYENLPAPENYYPNNDHTQKPMNTWRHTGQIYSNWVRAIYRATPYDINLIPEPYQRTK